MDYQQNQLLRSVLYYPTIKISSRWLRQSLLYWDQVGSIVPIDRAGNERLDLDDDLRYLLNEHEFHPVSPQQFLENQEAARSFTNELVETFDSSKFRKMLNSKQLSFNSTIHRHKMTEEILYILESHGLIHPVDRNIYGERRRWVRVENITAHVYMGILAKHIGQASHYVPGTNITAYENVIFAPLTREDRKQAAQISLRKILPFPLENTPVQEIVAFKRRRRDELQRFRQVIDEVQSKLGECENQDEVHQTLTRYDGLIRQGVDDLETTLGEQDILTRAGTINIIIGIAESAGLSWLTSQVMNSTNAGIAGFIGTGAVQLTNHWVSQKYSVNKTFRDSPYSYLYHAELESITARYRKNPA